MAQRRLSLELDLDSGNFTARMRGAGRETEVFQKKIDTTAASLARIDRGVNGTAARLRDFTLVMGNLRSAVENARFFFTGLAEAAVSATAEVERTTFLLRGLSQQTTEFGRRREAQENLESLIETAKEAPFSLQALSDTFVKFRAGGLDPTNGSMQSLLDAVAAFGGSDELLKRAAIAIQQMGGKGVISMEELRQQLGEAVPTAINLMAKGLGKTYEELVKEISQGKVRAEPALRAMFEQFEIAFGGKAQAMMDTFNGRVAQLKTSLVELAMAFTGMDTAGNVASGSFYDILKSGISDLTETISSEGFKTFAADFGSALATIATTTTSLAQSLGTLASFIPVLNNIKAVLLAVAMVAIAKLGGAAGNAINQWRQKTVEGITSTVRNLRAEGDAQRAVAREALFKAQEEVDSTRTSIVATRQRINELQAEERQIRENMAADQLRLAAANRQLATGRTATGQFANRGEAERARTSAVNALADAGRRLNTIQLESNRLQAVSNGLHAQQTGLLARVGVAQAAMRTALATNNALMIAGTIAARGLSAALAFFGGPIGIAIMAVAAAFTYLANEERNAATAGQNAQAILDDIAGQANLTRQQVEGLTTAQNDGAEATNTAADEARAGAGAYDSLAQAAANAAEWVKYLTAAQRQQKLEELRTARDDLDRAQDGSNPFTTNNREDVANKRARYVRLALGDQAARADRYDRTGGTLYAQRAASMATAEDAPRELREAYQEYRLAARAFNENNGRLRELNVGIEAILDAAGTPTLERPETPDTGTTPTGDTSSGGSSGGGRGGKRSANDVAMDQLRSMREQVAGINADIASAGKEAAKMQYALDHDPVLLQASAEIRDNLLAAAQAVDDANSRLEGFRAFEGLTEERDKQREAVVGLRQELELVMAGTEELVTENAKYRAGLSDNVKTAEQYTDQAAAMADEAARAQREASELSRSISSMRDLRAALLTSQGEAREAFTILSNGSSEADTQLQRYRRTVMDMANNVLPQYRAEARRVAEEAIQNFQRQRAFEAASDMVRETTAITRELFMTSSQAASAAHDEEVRLMWEKVNVAGMTADERRRVEDAYYAWRRAKEQELALDNPLGRMANEWKDVMGNLQEATAGWIDTLVNGLAEGEFSFKEFAKEVLKEILKIIMRAIVAQIILSAIGMANPGSGSMPSITGGDNGGLLPGALGGGRVGVWHDGGLGSNPPSTRRVDASMFDAVPKFHGGGIVGGLKPGEVHAILKKKEGVFTEEQMKALAPVGSGAAMPNVSVNVINESGTEMTAQQQGGGRFDGKNFILDVVIDAASKPGKMRDALRGASR